MNRKIESSGDYEPLGGKVCCPRCKAGILWRGVTLGGGGRFVSFLCKARCGFRATLTGKKASLRRVGANKLTCVFAALERHGAKRLVIQ